MKNIFTTVLFLFGLNYSFCNVYVVSNTNDSGPGSLRAALQSANGNAGMDSVLFDVIIDQNWITLSSTIAITDSVGIKGNGRMKTLIKGATPDFDLFEMSGGSVFIEGIHLQGGSTAFSQIGGISCFFSRVEVESCANHAFKILNSSGCMANFDLCVIHNNGGNGVEFQGNGSLILKNSTMMGNFFAAINVTGTVDFYEVINCTLADNQCSGGMGALSGVDAPQGPGTVRINHNTIINNGGDGLKIQENSANAGGIELYNNILWNNAGKDFNLIGTGSYNPNQNNNIVGSCVSSYGCPIWFSSADPLMLPGAPRDNGGEIPTLLFQDGSVAKDAAAYGYAYEGARGENRGEVPDIGAIELCSFTVYVDVLNVSCFGANNGRMIAQPSGSFNYSYKWIVAGLSTDTILNLAPYTDSVMVTDGDNCPVYSQAASVLEPSQITLDVAPNDAICFGESNGSLNGMGGGGNAPYLYSIDNTNWFSTGAFGGLASGSYLMKIKDASNCVDSAAPAIINQPAQVLQFVDHSNITCFGANDGQITVSPSGGTAPYTHSINEGITWQSSSIFTGLATGSYSVLTQDVNGCSAGGAQVKNIIEPAILSIAVSSLDVQCFGGNNGSIDGTPTGGIAPYLWSIDNGVSFQASNSFSVVSGTYNLRLKDSNNCVVDSSGIQVNQPAQMQLNNIIDSIKCFGFSNASICSQVINGLAPFTYSINGGQGQDTCFFDSLGVGAYLIQVTGEDGCLVKSDSIYLSQPADLDLNLVGNPPLCNGGSDGSLMITPIGGTSPFYFSMDGTNWSPDPNFAGLTSGIGLGYIKDTNLCVDSAFFMIEDNPILSLELTANSALCFGESSGQITAHAQGGIGGYQFNLDVGPWQSDSVFYGLNAGNYTVNLKDANNCLINKLDSVLEPSPLTSNPTVKSILCFGGFDGQIQFFPQGGIAPYSFSIDGGISYQVSDVFDSIGMGTYNLRLLDGNNCFTDTSIVLNQPDKLQASLLEQDASCEGSTDGQLTINANGGIPEYQYSLDSGITYQISNVFSGLSQGSYNIRLLDSNNCFMDTLALISEPVQLQMSFITQDAFCYGSSDGQITINVNGGTAPYLFSNDGGNSFQASNMFGALPAGNYLLKIKDVNNCMVDSNATVLEPSQVAFSTVLSHVKCFGGLTGAIEIFASGGSGNYSYSLDGSSYQASNVFENLGAGMHTVFVKDDNNCMDFSGITINQPTQLGTNLSIIPVDCFGVASGAIMSDGIGGLLPYVYSLDTISGYEISGNFNNISAGNYTLFVKDSNNCLFDTSFVINQPTELVMGSQVLHSTCNGADNGNVTLSGSGGTPNYVFSNDGGLSFTSNGYFGGLVPGIYHLVLKDNNNCVVEDSVTIVEPSQLGGNVAVANVLCYNDANGAIQVQATGGTAGYSYSLDGGVTFQYSNNFSGLLSANYNITVKDTNNCTALISGVWVDQPNILNIFPSVSHLSCFNAADGQLDIVTNGGIQPYEFSLDGTNYLGSSSFSDLNAGTYNVYVKDSNGCLADSLNVQINQPAEITFDLTNMVIVPANCNGTGGEISGIVPSGGAGGFSYNWNNIQGQNGLNLTNAPYGDWQLAVTDITGCVAVSDTFSINWINTPLLLSLSSTDPTCNDKFNGSASVIANGGTAPYNFQWNQGGINQTISGLGAGNYTVYVSDVNGCEGTGSIELFQPPALQVTVNAAPADCGMANGSAMVSNVTGGTPGYNYYWSTGQGGNTITGLNSGNYMVVVLDQNQCSASKVVHVGSSGLSLNFSGVSPTCHAGLDGSIDLTITGGSGNYSVLWDHLQSTTEDLIGLSGNRYYGVAVSDGAGCKANAGIFLQDAPAIDLSNYTVTSAGCGMEDGQISLLPAGGSGNYQYQWNDNLNSTTPVLNGVGYGVYTVRVTDDNNCSDSVSIAVSNTGAPIIVVNEIRQPTCNQFDGKVLVTTSPAGNYSYTWRKTSELGQPIVATTEDFLTANIGAYFLKVDDGQGCKSTLHVNMPGVNLEPQKICMVTVEDSNNVQFNRIVWEKDNTVGIEFYEIYRMNALGSWQLIAEQPVSQLSRFDDYNADPDAHAYKYRLKTVDGCGNTSVFEAEHKTIHLIATSVGSTSELVWDAYEGVNDFTNYIIERSIQPAGGLATVEDIATVPSGTTSFVDNLPPDTADYTIVYVVRIDFDTPCSAEKIVDHNNTRSNKGATSYGGGDLVFGIAELELHAEAFPNPTNGIFSLITDSKLPKHIKIFGIDGRMVKQLSSFDNRLEIDLSGVESGLYFVQVQSGVLRKVLQIVIE